MENMQILRVREVVIRVWKVISQTKHSTRYFFMHKLQQFKSKLCVYWRYILKPTNFFNLGQWKRKQVNQISDIGPVDNLGHEKREHVRLNLWDYDIFSVRPEVAAALLSRMRSVSSEKSDDPGPLDISITEGLTLYVGARSMASKVVWLYMLQVIKILYNMSISPGDIFIN